MSRNALPYYKKYPRDFIEGTVGMSLELKGAYSLILDLIYLQSGKLPDDPRYISGLLGCTIRKWNTLRKQLIEMGKIYVNGELLSNYRADNELETQRKLQDKNAESGRTSNKNKDLPKTNVKLTRVNQNQNHIEKDIDKSISKKKRENPLLELVPAIGDDLARAVIDHRKKIRKPLTQYAAKLLANKFRKTEHPKDAAKMMIANGWQGFEVGWFQKQKSNGTGNGSYSTKAERSNEVANKYIEAERRQKDVKNRSNQLALGKLQS